MTKDVTPKHPDLENPAKDFKLLLDFLEQYQLFAPNINHLFGELLGDEKFQESLLDLIQLMTNKNIRELFEVTVNDRG